MPQNGFAAATRYFAFPRNTGRASSTNGVERLHVEIKRRTRSVGAFPDRASALRLVTAVVLHETAIWSDRRYLDMDLLNESKVDYVKQPEPNEERLEKRRYTEFGT